MRGATIKQVLGENSPDVVCLTESHRSFLDGGHQIEATADYGYPQIGDRRKVLLWSREPWSEIDCIGHAAMPEGRFIRGRTKTPIGELTVFGICIPWASAHVSSGRRDSARWQEHGKFIDGLRDVLAEAGPRAVVLGDFNQTFPRTHQPIAVSEALEAAFAKQFSLITANLSDQSGRFAIDHLLHSLDLESEVQSILPAAHDGRHLSDHFGAVVAVRERGK